MLRNIVVVIILLHAIYLYLIFVIIDVVAIVVVITSKYGFLIFFRDEGNVGAKRRRKYV